MNSRLLRKKFPSGSRASLIWGDSNFANIAVAEASERAFAVIEVSYIEDFMSEDRNESLYSRSDIDGCDDTFKFKGVFSGLVGMVANKGPASE